MRVFASLVLCTLATAAYLAPEADAEIDPMQNVSETENTEVIPSLLHQVWTDGDVGSVLKGFSESWKVLNPTWTYRLWKLSDVEQLIDTHYSWFAPTFRGLPLPSHRILLSKFFILDQFGGVVADMGTQCVRPLNDLIADLRHHNASVAIPFDLTGGNFVTEVLISVPNHRIWTAIASRVFEANWQTFGDDNILPVLVTKEVQEYLNQPSGTEVYPVPVSNVLESEDDLVRSSSVVALVHFTSDQPSVATPVDVSKLPANQPVVIQSRILLSTINALGPRGIDFVSDHWMALQKVLTDIFPSLTDVQLLTFVPATTNSLTFDFSASLRNSETEEFSRVLVDSVNSGKFEKVAAANGLNIRDALVVLAPLVNKVFRSESEHSTVAMLLQSRQEIISIGPFNSSSPECQGASGAAVCCCATFDSAKSFYTDCRIASVWMIQDKCPSAFPYSIPSASFSTDLDTTSTCTSNTTVEDLLSICELSRCEQGVVETCDCLQKYINQCFMVGPSAPFPEPCALTRDMARNYVTAKKCGNETVVCHKPLYLVGTQYSDDCQDSTALNGTCNLSCAPGYMPLETSTSNSTQIQCSVDGWMVLSGDLECQQILNCSTSFLTDSVGLVHDCEEGAPMGSQCQMSCEPGFASNVTDEDRITSYCKMVVPGLAEYDRSITCQPTFCSTLVIPSGVNHNCTEGGSIHSTCTLTCPTGEVGESVPAVCVGHGGKKGIAPWAEFEFDPLNCTVYVEYPQLASMVVYAHSASGDISLQISPEFNANVTKYSLSVPSRISQIRLEFGATKSWAQVTEITCDGCDGAGSGEGVFVLGATLHEINVLVNFTKEPYTSNTYQLFVNRLQEIHPQQEIDAVSEIKLDTQYSEDWIEKNGPTFTQTVANFMNISQEQVMILSATNGSVKIVFAVHTSDVETKATGLENAIADGKFSKQLCELSQVCATQITVTSPLLAAKEPLRWPPSTAPPPPICGSLEALTCAHHFINRGCSNAEMPAFCQNTRECLDHVRENNCNYPIEHISGCYRTATQAELACEYSFVEKGCDETVFSRTCPQEACHNATVAQVCPLVQECSSQEARMCVDMYITNQCLSPVVVSGCHRYLECQVRAKNSVNGLCPVPALATSPCTTTEALSCINQLIAGGCRKAIVTPECVGYLPCQKLVVRGQDPFHRCPVVSAPPSVASDAVSKWTAQQLLWMHLLLFYRFQLLMGMAYPHTFAGAATLL
eukprot:c6833_g1_i1.p1 GENE.c6833_g1_i1~~c6833_g1_i1.p1  ORF type:complete len:1235 (-),score=348.34 c6833_g1_i1:19-3693(-)